MHKSYLVQQDVTDAVAETLPCTYNLLYFMQVVLIFYYCTQCVEAYYFCDEAVIQQHSRKCHPTTCFYVIICQIQLLCEGIFLEK